MRFLFSLALVLTVALIAEAGPGRHSSCAGGSCGGGSCSGGGCGMAPPAAPTLRWYAYPDATGDQMLWDGGRFLGAFIASSGAFHPWQDGKYLSPVKP